MYYSTYLCIILCNLCASIVVISNLNLGRYYFSTVGTFVEINFSRKENLTIYDGVSAYDLLIYEINK